MSMLAHNNNEEQALRIAAKIEPCKPRIQVFPQLDNILHDDIWSE